MGVEYWCVSDGTDGKTKYLLYVGKNLDPDRIESCRRLVEIYDDFDSGFFDDFVDDGTVGVLMTNLRKAIFEACDGVRTLTAALASYRYGCTVMSEEYVHELLENSGAERLVYIDPTVPTVYVRVKEGGQWKDAAEF
jgi:hypothetical protein